MPMDQAWLLPDWWVVAGTARLGPMRRETAEAYAAALRAHRNLWAGQMRTVLVESGRPRGRRDTAASRKAASGGIPCNRTTGRGRPRPPGNCPAH